MKLRPDFFKFIFKIIVRFLCPAALGESLDDLTSSMLLFPSLSNWKHVSALIVIYFFYLVYMVDGLLYRFIETYFMPLPRASLGPILNLIHILCGLVICEIVFLRSYCVLMTVKYGKDSIGWYRMVRKMNKREDRNLFKLSQLLFPLLYAGIASVYLANKMIKLTKERSTQLDYIFNITWVTSELILLRFTIIELPLLYIIASACYLKLTKQLDELLADFSKPFMSDPIMKYKQLVNSILDVNPLMQVISFMNSLLVIPFVEIVIVLSMTETENRFQSIIKYLYLPPASVYALRGMVITTILAPIDSKSRLLYKSIASRIAHEQVTGCVSQRQLILIMEDLSCSRNHICMREFSGSPSNQIDIMMNIIAIGQFVMLLLDFSMEFIAE